MAGNILEIKKQLKSLKNTGKITKAMELVSASKMRKSVARATSSREYSYSIMDLIEKTASVLKFDATDASVNFFTVDNNAKEDMLVVVSSNKGLCGAFNSNITKLALKFLKNNDRNSRVICIGKKSASQIKARGFKIEMVYDDEKNRENIGNQVSRLIFEEVKNGNVGRVFILFTDFKSSLLQKTVIKQLMPFGADEPITGIIGDDIFRATSSNSVLSSDLQYVFEPDPEIVLSHLVSSFVDALLGQAILENSASEHSARMVSMKNATKASGEMYDNLSSVFNKTRQGKITQELAEISAGRMALEN